jgi:predicted AAA+ superfamily ATPase
LQNYSIITEENMNTNYIKRPTYIDKIKPFIGKQIIKVLTGQRRVGKSYILLQLMDEIKAMHTDANIIYINIEYSENESLRTHTALYQHVCDRLKENAPNFLLIDEVQEIQSFELCLRSLLAESKCDITCTGSNAQMLSGEIATTLSGRYVQIPVYSLSYPEFLEFHQLKDTNESLVMYLRLGGMPYLKHIGLEAEVVMEYLKNVNSTILLKDVVARENIRNVSFLENLTAYLADNTGSLLSAFNISKYLKSQHQQIPTQTILNYLRALTHAYYVHKVQRAEVKGLKIFEIGEKYYFEDTGLRNALRRFDFRSDVHKVMENVVYLHLLRNGYRVFVGINGNKEIDFMAEKNDERLYIQVSYMLVDDQTIQREFGNLIAIDDNYPKYVVTMDELSAGTAYKGIRQIHLRDFLMNYN